LRLYLTTLNPTDSVVDGFLPAAAALGWDVTVLTDQPGRYGEHAEDVIETDVRDAAAVIDTIAGHHAPDVIFSNSDHLQAATALAAAYFGLPGKDWRACLTAKNKALTRRALAAAGVETVRSARLRPGAPPPDGLPYPVVVKPREGVASEDVILCRDEAELLRAAAAIWARRPGATLVAEEYLEGPLRTLETLGDGRVTRVIGGFRTHLGPPPYFVEERLDWDPPPAQAREPAHVLLALGALGVGFGACHTEYVVTGEGPRIIEVNYRVIGDNCDFLLADVLGVPLHEWILRVHAGEPAPPPPEAPARYGTAVSVVAGSEGVVRQAPPVTTPDAAGEVRLWHRPMRAVGDRITLTNTNRDYLGVIRAVGPDRAAVDAEVSRFRAAHPWVIR
jgi:biotin carboxylase